MGQGRDDGERSSARLGAGSLVATGASDGGLQQARIALSLMEGTPEQPGVLRTFEQAIAGRNYPSAIHVAQRWTLMADDIARLAHPGTQAPLDEVTRARALQARMVALAPFLPGATEPNDAAGRAAWLAKLPAVATGELHGSATPVGSHATGIADGASDWDDIKRSALSSPFHVLPREVTDVVYGPLSGQLRQRDHLHFLLDPLGHDPVKAEVADVAADLADDPEFFIGFAEGSIHGAGRAIYDSAKGFYDAGMLAKELLDSFSRADYRALLRRGKREIDELLAAAKAIPGGLEQFARRWRTAGSHARGEFQGEAIAYIVTQLAIMLAGSLTGGAALTGPFAGVVKALGWLDNPLAGLGELAAELRLSSVAIEGLRAARGMRTAEVRGARALTGADHVADEMTTVRRAPQAGELAADAEALRLARMLALDEIAKMPIERVAKGAAPGITRDTLYLARADGERLPDLLRSIKPDLDIKPYRAGLLVRDGGNEWWLEFRDRAAGEHALSSTRGDLGLPESNVATVELIGYRGVREIDGRPEAEWTAAERAQVDALGRRDPLIRAGHVAISFDGGHTLYGLTPKTGDMKLEDVIAKLKTNEIFPGNVQDDSERFVLATEMASHGWNTQPVRVVVSFDRSEQPIMFEHVVATKAANARGEHPLAYGWPVKQANGEHAFRGGAASDGQMFDASCVSNCATWPAHVGVPIPERTGRMQDYMRELEVWAHADAPIDGNMLREPR